MCCFYTLLKNASKEYNYKLYIVHTTLKKSHMHRINKIISYFSNAEVVFKMLQNTILLGKG